jgi:hypothetical protein
LQLSRPEPSDDDYRRKLDSSPPPSAVAKRKPNQRWRILKSAQCELVERNLAKCPTCCSRSLARNVTCWQHDLVLSASTNVLSHWFLSWTSPTYR